MRKKVLSVILSVLIILSFSLSNIPFNDLNTVNAETNIATNFIDFLRTNLGLAKVNNGSLSNVSRDDFAQSLYNTPLVWTDNGVNFSFTPSNEFSKSQWNQMCIYGGSDDTRFVDFDLQDCLIKSQYIEDNGSGLNLSNFPKLADNINTSSPLDGIEVITNFSDFNPSFNELKRPYSSQNTFNNIKSYCINNYNNLIILKNTDNVNYNAIIYSFISPKDSVDFIGFYKSGVSYRFYIHSPTSQIWGSIYNSPCLISSTSSSSSQRDYVYLGSGNTAYFNGLNGFTEYDSSVISTSSSNYSVYNINTSFWGNIPVIIGSDSQVLQNYYYWMKGIPDGSFYSTANTNIIYNYDYITNNNWETAYNNYITDVSNYYSTTENITNEELSNYIDQSTTITNITNNYITNNQGGTGEDDVITNSWLERIFNKLEEIKDILLGKNIYDPDDDIPNLTDDSIKNDLLRFPAENLFPDLNDEDIITPEDIIENDNKIPWDMITSKMGSVISEVVPFCYIFQMKSLFLALSAPPQDPYFEIPFYIERLGIDEYVTIDLTAQAWDNLHTIWITLFLIIFLAFLFYLTHKILMLISNMFV